MDRRGPDPDGRAPRAPDVRDLAPPSPPLDGGAEGPRFEYVPGPSSGTLHFERRGSVDEGGFAGDGARASGRGPALRLGSLSGGSPTPQEEGDPSAPDAPPPETNPEPTCETEVIEPGVCVDITELKTQASEALCADGLFLTAFDIDLGSCGENLATAAKYTCCPPTSSPPPEEKPSETPGPSNCKTLTVETTACTAFSAIDEEAVKQCGTGALVVDHKYYGECPDGAATQGWFTCCPVAEDNQPG